MWRGLVEAIRFRNFGMSIWDSARCDTISTHPNKCKALPLQWMFSLPPRARMCCAHAWCYVIASEFWENWEQALVLLKLQCCNTNRRLRLFWCSRPGGFASVWVMQWHQTWQEQACCFESAGAPKLLPFFSASTIYRIEYETDATFLCRCKENRKWGTELVDRYQRYAQEEAWSFRFAIRDVSIFISISIYIYLIIFIKGSLAEKLPIYEQHRRVIESLRNSRVN